MGDKIHEPLFDIENVLPILNKIAIFGGLNDKQLYTVFRLLERVSYKKNEWIYRRGDAPSHIYIVQRGDVRIFVDEEGTSLELISFSTGDCFGETAVIGIQPHSSSALAAADTDLIVLEHRALLSIFELDKELFSLLILNIAREACRRLHKADDILLHYVFARKTK